MPDTPPIPPEDQKKSGEITPSQKAVESAKFVEMLANIDNSQVDEVEKNKRRDRVYREWDHENAVDRQTHREHKRTTSTYFYLTVGGYSLVGVLTLLSWLASMGVFPLIDKADGQAAVKVLVGVLIGGFLSDMKNKSKPKE
ncbi:MAG: hypothetical protein KF824_12400 [Fimbriimonadaceae bacterium]|nr:MAG: hypothetical protein KF824_12400 [Fimbriimonadaceae bacterium]